MTDIGWNLLKEFYKEKFGLDGWVVEMYANMDILCLCASGASNETIEKFLEIPLEEIKPVLEDTFEFPGWDEDLPINPYRMFCNYGGQISSVQHFSDFVKETELELSKYSNSIHKDVSKMFYLCETMYDIERKIQDEWI